MLGREGIKWDKRNVLEELFGETAVLSFFYSICLNMVGLLAI